jgi:hypothetical protein
MTEACLCLREQRLEPPAKKIRMDLLEFYRESRGDERAMHDMRAVHSVLSKAVDKAAEHEECLDPVSALRSVHEVLRSMESLPAGLRYGDLEECQTTIKQLSTTDCKEVAAKFKQHLDKLNKEKNDVKRKVGAVAGLAKLRVSWMDETTINSHMNERQLVDFSRKFEEIVSELCTDDRLTKFAEGSSKSSEDYVKKVLLQSVLLEDANFKEALTYNVSIVLRERGLAITEMRHEEFLHVLKETLFEKMQAIGMKAKAK